MEDNKKKKLAVFTDSYDGMSDVWPYYYQIFDKYWPNCQLNRYLVTNLKEYRTENLTILQTGEDKDWFTMTYKALLSVKEKYIFFMIEDDFMSESVEEDILFEIITYMEENDVFFYRFTCPLNFPQNQGFLSVHGDVIYPISVQPAIWRVDVLMGYISELHNKGCKSPWDFERYFIDLYRNYSKEDTIPCIRYDSRRLFGFTNGIIQGKWDPRIVKYFKKQEILIDTEQRGVMPFRTVLLDQIKRNKLIRSLSFEQQAKVKKVFKRLGIKFIT